MMLKDVEEAEDQKLVKCGTGPEQPHLALTFCKDKEHMLENRVIRNKT
jgi:hypothetical protein